ncbi:putative serine-threonine protein kinase plant-type [Tripterygium wilfordii]|uniref:Putative serine-threonine protein kinase plant-type n=1 Tax=Tripterygium wilfordii TaxID=458696 RepID=A0A7J7CBA8_TRIWF|nr:proline-rich receptor-like protein kinase PERK10 [Tripterygium wilfordii]KAF5731423.1 putative serine-threonine protein kinase plant-type [Tripterygium wilfordii]
MNSRERREGKQTIVIVLEGMKVSTERRSLAPLWKAMNGGLSVEDEILVLTLLHIKPSETSLCGGFDVDRCSCWQSWEGQKYIKFLNREIGRRKEAYIQIFRPFYDSCKSEGVKFQVKVAAGFRPVETIVEEANIAKATWIVIDSCFAGDLSFRLSGTDCKMSMVSDHGEAIGCNYLVMNDEAQSSTAAEVNCSPKSPKLMTALLSGQQHQASDSFTEPSLPRSTCKETEKEQTNAEPYEQNEIKPSTQIIGSQENIFASEVDVLRRTPVELSWEIIVELTNGMWSVAQRSQEYCSTYYGYLSERASYVYLKRFSGNSSHDKLEAEIKAALYLHHKNIMSLIGYHKSENNTVLVFPYVREMTLDHYICESRRKYAESTFQEKMKIAIGIAQGVRYMHEECPRAPIAHGGLQPSIIVLTSSLRPMISGFERSTWLHLDPAPPVFNRCWLNDPLDHKSMELVKSDILSFGMLLLRLFCGRSAPLDDDKLMEWARPLLLQGAFHMLLESDDVDVHALYRVMNAATQCTRTNPISRPSISEVLSILKGEKDCTMISSPSENSF